MSELETTEDRWTVETLVKTAQAYDSRARTFRENDNEDHPYFDYSVSRKLAFDARKFARQKIKNQ
jgi:hypothetical protein